MFPYMKLGNITYIQSRSSYRFRYGKKSPIVKNFKTKKAATEFQKQFTKSHLHQGKQATETLLGNSEPIKEALRLLSEANLGVETLPTAVASYLNSVDAQASSITLENALRAMISCQRFKSLSKACQRDYKSIAFNYAEYIGMKTALKDITTAQIQAFIDKQSTPASRSKHHRIIGVLYRVYLMNALQLVSADPTVRLKQPAPQKTRFKEVYSYDEVKALLTSPVDLGSELRTLALKMVLPKVRLQAWLAFMTGMRVSELYRLKKEDFFKGNTFRGAIFLPTTKEGKNKNVKLPKNLLSYLEKSSAFKEAAMDKQLLFSQKAYTAHFKDLCEAVGVTYKEVGTSRHTFASHAVDGWLGGVREVAWQLGHGGESTTINHYHNSVDPSDAACYFQITVTR